MKTAIPLAVLFASAAFAKPQPGLPFLLIWPTARSTATAGDTRTLDRHLAIAPVPV